MYPGNVTSLKRLNVEYIIKVRILTGCTRQVPKKDRAKTTEQRLVITRLQVRNKPNLELVFDGEIWALLRRHSIAKM